MKSIFIAAILLVSTAGIANAGTIRVQNQDSSSYTVKLKCSGSSKSINIKSSTTASYTFHSSSKSCDIVGGGISFPVGTMEDGQKWTIKNGKAKKS
ncbi:MAG: hypothetical protein ACI9MR_001257 [Myxococcota bacterium]|jgi:hypothetical protein